MKMFLPFSKLRQQQQQQPELIIVYMVATKWFNMDFKKEDLSREVKYLCLSNFPTLLILKNLSLK